MDPPIILSATDLLPASWRGLADRGPVRTFNPGLLRQGDGWILAYRVVGMDTIRRIALCRLDRRLRIVPGTATPASDLVRFAPQGYSERAASWFADPRLYRLEGRFFLYWNSGWHDPQNHQFLQEWDERTFLPVGPPRELQLRGARRALEKNWALFGEGPIHAVYSANPHRILACPLGGTGEIVCTDDGTSPWNDGGYAARWGELRGGAPPQRLGDRYYSFGHSVHPGADGYDYSAAVYRFGAEAPFVPTDAPAGPLLLPNPFGAKRLHLKLNPAVGEVIYPCGAIHDGNRWIVSYGINDEHCALAAIPEDDVLKSLISLHD